MTEPTPDTLRAAYIAALDEAHQTHPCPATGRPYWLGCVHYDDAGRMEGVGSCHSGRRADAVLAVRDEEMERLRAELDRVTANRDYWRNRYRSESRTTWSSEVPPGGEVCADCGEPVESEPCAEHNPTAVAEQLRARVTELEALTPAKHQTCRVCGAGYEYGQPCSSCQFKALMAAERGDSR